MNDYTDKAAYPHSETTGKIIAAALEVHRELGPGYLERIYENALMCELATSGISARQQVSYPVVYKGKAVGTHVLDMVVENKVYVELKCQKITGLETAQVLSGLKASGLVVGLLINFDTRYLKNGIKRVVRSGDRTC